MKGTLASIAGCLAFVLVIAVPITVSTAEAAGSACLPASVTVSGAVPASLRLDVEQQANARIIVSTVVGRRMPTRAAVIAVATALQESSLRNLSTGDRDSLGLFQQRPSQGWGRPLQVMDPGQSTNRFLDRLQQVPAWPVLPLGQVAQSVQNSAIPEAYARWEPTATALVNRMLARPEPTAADPGRDLPDLPGLLVLGDSQLSSMAGRWPATYNGGPVSVDVVPGRSSREGLGALRQRESLPGVLVLSLGVDDPAGARKQLPSRIELVLRLVGTERLVYWLAPAGTGSRKARAAVVDAAMANHQLQRINAAGLADLMSAEIGRGIGDIVEPVQAPGCDDGFAGYGSVVLGDCQFALAQQNPRTCQDAVRWALAQVDGPAVWLRRCLNFVAQAYGYRASGVLTAADYWAAATQRQAGNPDPPPGALVFWDTGEPAGHVALSAGGGMVISNDVGGAGTITALPLTDLTTRWNARYLGWAPPFFPHGI